MNRRDYSRQNNPHWRGGIRINPYGYIITHKPEHHFASTNGYVYYHRIVYESYHQCCLLRWASVHHKDRNKRNNFPSNLHGMMKRHHDSMETEGMWKRGIFKNKKLTPKDPITGRFVGLNA